MEKLKWNRRLFPRWRVRGLLPGWFGDSLKVFVVDISMVGALIEHPNTLRPGTSRLMTLSLSGEKISLKCRVVRSDVYTQEAWPTAEENYIFRTGLEVLELSEASQALIGEYIQSLEAEPATCGN